MKGVEYPLVEHELPEFVIWSPEELIEENRRLAKEARLKAIEEARLASIRALEEELKAIEEARQA